MHHPAQLGAVLVGRHFQSPGTAASQEKRSLHLSFGAEISVWVTNRWLLCSSPPLESLSFTLLSHCNMLRLWRAQ